MPAKVVISTPGKGIDATIVMGINDETYDPTHHGVVPNASVTKNCVAPMVKVLNDAFGIQQGFMTKVHAYTGDRNLLDWPHMDPRRARSARGQVIPTTTTGAASSEDQWVAVVAGSAGLRTPVDPLRQCLFTVALDRDTHPR